MTALAEQSDIESLLGRALTDVEEPRLDALLASASARFRTEAGGRQFGAGTATTVLRVVDGAVHLPQQPVNSVTSVKAIDTDGTPGATIGTWVFDGIGEVRVDDWWITQINAPALAEDDWSGTVEVTYTYGYATIPDDVRWAVAGMVVRALASTAAGSGIESETIGGYSYRLGGAATSGILGMTADEVAIARRYRRPGLRSVALR